MSGKVTVFISSTSSNTDVKKKQQHIQDVLTSLKIDFETLDVCIDNNLAKMREIVGDGKALAPQIVNGDEFCGNYEAFEEAVEDKEVQKFVKLA